MRTLAARPRIAASIRCIAHNGFVYLRHALLDYSGYGFQRKSSGISHIRCQQAWFDFLAGKRRQFDNGYLPPCPFTRRALCSVILFSPLGGLVRADFSSLVNGVNSVTVTYSQPFVFGLLGSTWRVILFRSWCISENYIHERTQVEVVPVCRALGRYVVLERVRSGARESAVQVVRRRCGQCRSCGKRNLCERNIHDSCVGAIHLGYG